ncbi:hypothetical protein HOLleu_39058 [Holothuria leucospilota]|uniref:Uncharacterized protein n=1 Tax=Holothuria leucospilota TaxID=206669 RepID=A0A9Q0YI36_HOLLE|nr:hypothetical protein HOLleu_39058 [Holothuria leucospilota]
MGPTSQGNKRVVSHHIQVQARQNCPSRRYQGGVSPGPNCRLGQRCLKVSVVE